MHRLRILFQCTLILLVNVLISRAQDPIDVPIESQKFSLESTDLGFIQNHVNLYTGDLELPLNLVSMDAPGGINVDLTLFYNSNTERTSHQWERDTPTGVMGYGWSFKYPSIIVDNKNTATRHDDEFYLSDGNPNKLVCTSISEMYYVDDLGDFYAAARYKTKSYSPYTYYYIESLERWEVWIEGYKYVYGCKNQNPTAVQWIVNWGNWIGSSSVALNSENQAIEWNLAKVQNQWGQYVKYEYQNRNLPISQTAGSLTYTESSLLKTISQTGSFKIELNYNPKGGNESYDPHTNISYQDRFVKDYLSSVDLYNGDNEIQKTVHLSYSFTSEQYSKRLLTEVKSVNNLGHWTEPLSFEYQDYALVNQIYNQKLSRIVSPTGSQISFTYGNQTINNLSTTITLPAGYSQKQVWSGSDYTLVALRNPSTYDTKFYVYWWDGKWESNELFNLVIPSTDISTNTTNGRTFLELKNFQVRLENDHIGFAYKNSAISNNYFLGRAYKDNNNTWMGSLESIAVGAEVPILVSGNYFVGLSEKRNNIIHIYTRTSSNLWTSSTLSMPSGAYRYYVTSKNNFIFCQAYMNGTGDYDQLKLFYLNQKCEWNSVNIPQSYSIVNDTDPYSALYADHSFVYIHQFGNTKGYLYKWNKDYSFDSNSKQEITGLSGTMKDVATYKNSNLLIQLSNECRVLRYNSNNWQSYPNTLAGSYNSGPILIQNFLPGDEYKSYYYYPDPNAQPSSIQNSIGDDFFTLNEKLYQYDPSTNDWQITSPNVAIISVKGVYGNGLAAQVLYYSNENPPVTTPIDECYYLRNDGVFVKLLKSSPFDQVRSKTLSRDFFFALDGSVEKFFIRVNHIVYQRSITGNFIFTGDKKEENFVGPTSFVTYSTDHSLIIHKVLSGAYDNGSISDRAVTGVTVNDGIRDLTTTFSYTGSLQRYDENGAANYEEVRVTPGTGIGYVVHKFFNGTATTGANFGNESSYYRVLKGAKYRTITYSQTGAEVAREEIGYNVTTDNDYIIPRVNKVRSVLDNVEKITEYTYNSKYQLSKVTFKNYDTNGNQDVIINNQMFNWEGSGYNLVSKGIFSGVIQNWKTVNGNTIDMSAIRWKNWGNGKWAPESSFQWIGGTPDFSYYFNSTSTPTGWLKTNTITARDTYGNVSEVLGMDGIYSAGIYGFNGTYPLLTAYNSQLNGLFFDDFNGGITNGWYYSSGVVISDKLTFGVGSGSYVAHLMGSGTVSSNVDFKVRLTDATTSGWAGYVFNKPSAASAWNAAGNISVQIKANSSTQFGVSVFQGASLLANTVCSGNVTDWHTVSVKFYNDASSPWIDILMDGNELLTQVEVGSILSATNYRAFHSENRTAEFDHYRVYPANALTSSISIDRKKRQLIETMDSNGLLVSNYFNGWGVPVGTSDPDGIPIQTISGASSTKYNTGFSVSDPSRVLKTVVGGAKGFVDDFSYAKNWTVYNSTSNSTWMRQDNRLVNTSTAAFSGLKGYFYDLGQEYSGRVSLEFDVWSSSNSSPVAFGFMAGGNLWNYTTTGSELGGWLELHDAGVYLRNGAIWDNAINATGVFGDKSVRIKVVIESGGKVDYYLDGKHLASYNHVSTTTGIQKFGFYVTSSTTGVHSWNVDNLMVYTDGIESQIFTDAVGKPLQSNTRGVSNTEIYTTETIYDALGRSLGQSKTTKQNSGILNFQQNFIQNFNESTGVLTGDVYSLNGNDSYAYASSRFDNTPMGRVVKSGSAGASFSAYSSHANQFSYTGNSSSSSSEYYMGTGYTVSNRYSANKVTDADGNKSISFYDKAGNLVLTKSNPVQVTYDSPQTSSMTISLNSSNTSGSFTATHNQTVSWGVYGVLLIGTGGYGTSNIVFSTTGSGAGGTFNAIQGTTYYIVYSGSYGGSVSYVDQYIERSTQLITKYEYDDAGNLIKIYPPNYFDNPGTSSSSNYITSMSYDLLGRMIQKTSPDEGVVKYVYDYFGRLKFSQDARGASEGFVKYWTYDLFGRPVEEGYWNRSWTGLTSETAVPVLATWRVKYNYEYIDLNRPGQLLSISTNNDDNTNAETSEFFEYDRYNQVTSVTLYNYGYDNTGNVITYQYDRLGRVSKEDYGSGFVVSYNRYATNGALKSIGTATDADRFANYTYDINGRLSQEILDDNSFARAYTYDSRGMLSKIDDPRMTEDLSYTANGYGGAAYYNGLIARTSFTFKSAGWTGATRPSDYNYSFAYDAVGRLRVADHSAISSYDIGVGANSQIRYDANGNYMKVIENVALKDYEYLAGTNKVKNTTGSTTTNQYTYDVNANVKSSTPKNLTNINYDKYFNITTQISRTVSGSSYNTYYHYARGGRTYKYDLISTGASWVKTSYVRGLHSVPVIEKSKNQAGTTNTIRYVYGPLGIIASQQNGTFYFHLRDHLGSTRIVLTDAGSVQSVYNYTPLGETITNTVGEDNDYTFTGQEYDEETGLYNYVARLYDSDLGRFYGTDPHGLSYPSISGFSYVMNNPISFTDPTGMDYTWDDPNDYWDSQGNYIGPSYPDDDFYNYAVNSTDRSGNPLVNPGFTPEVWAIIVTGWNETEWGENSTYYPEASGEWGFWVTPIYSFDDFNGNVGTYKNAKTEWVSTARKESQSSFANAGYDWSTTGNTLVAGGVTYAGIENAIANKYWWMDASGNYNSTKILEKGANGKFVRGVQGYKNGYNIALNTASKFKIAGNVVGGLSLGVTFLQYDQGQISGLEATVDTIFGVVGFLGPIGAGISATYFVGKIGYEYFSGNTVFDKPR